MVLKDVRKLASNTRALLFLQLANYVLPFILIPFLTRALGVSVYGVVALGLAMVQLACVITDFGFNLSATHQISSSLEDRVFVRKIVGAVHVCKTLLLVPIVFFILVFLIFQDHKYGEYKVFFWLLLLPVLGQTFQPVWLFQGIERMGFITLFVVVARSSYVALVLVWVDTSADYVWVAIANGVAQITAAVLAVVFMVRLGYAPVWPGWHFVKNTFCNSIEFFWARAAVASYTAGGAFYLGLVSGPTTVACYSAAEQLYKGAQALFQPLSQALYPYMTRNKDLNLFFKILKVVILLSIIGLGTGLLIGKWLLVALFGPEFSESYPVLVVFMLTFCITMPSILFGYPFLGALGDSRSANRSVIIGGMIQVCLLIVIFALGWTDGLVVSGSVMLVESFVLVYRALKVRSMTKTLEA